MPAVSVSADQLMGEAPRDVASSRGAFQDAGLLRLVQRRHQCRRCRFRPHLRADRVRKWRPITCRGSQHVQGFRQTRAATGAPARCRTVSGTSTSSKSSGACPVIARVEQPAFFLQVPEQLGDEQRIPAGVIGELSDDRRRRVWLSECCEHPCTSGWLNGRSVIARA